MRPRPLRLVVSSAALAAATLIAATAAPAQAAPDRSRPIAQAAPSGTAPVFAATDRLAREVAAALADPAVRGRVVPAVTRGPVDLLAARLDARVERAASSANQAVLAAKGLPAATGSVLQLRLGHRDMAAALTRHEIPLVAAASTDDALTGVVGYDPAGGQVLLDPVRLPDRPALVVEVDVAKAMGRGLAQVRQELAAQGLTGVTPTMSAQSGYWATKVNAIRLNDDKEPWVKGGAEIFNVVGGFGLDGKATVNIVEMPYLDNDGTVYYPNQLLVHFNNYKYNLADVVMWEDDGDTNYRDLAKALITALLTVVDYGMYTPLVNAIIDAMPTSWWTDDPDYVDSWYTLSTGSSGRLNGAAANGWMDVAPYWVQQL
ncbi:DUF3103 domain-containing protein [Micromonospora yasonensis]|uniref:DUF3103 domain-containing protein n=1 Tax=Micromonospora yasonensis TaxID=1128667 RepID=UPI0022309D69|nr:DUF3103 domain-containing protein [Micromonospora yasonensis]MCW3842982.1 DUF3103 domain-containing protein [Micromonospora yasonensis]